MSNTSNPCIRCGRERIVERSWVENSNTMLGTSEITHTRMICPDPACQMKLEKQLAAERTKRDERAKQKEQQLSERKQGFAKAKTVE